MWPEINSRVNYPLKYALAQMDNNRTIDMQNKTHKFCVSHVTQLVASFGLDIVVRSWNEHPIRVIYLYFIPNDKMYTIIVIINGKFYSKIVWSLLF